MSGPIVTDLSLFFLLCCTCWACSFASAMTNNTNSTLHSDKVSSVTFGHCKFDVSEAVVVVEVVVMVAEVDEVEVVRFLFLEFLLFLLTV